MRVQFQVKQTLTVLKDFLPLIATMQCGNTPRQALIILGRGEHGSRVRSRWFSDQPEHSTGPCLRPKKVAGRKNRQDELKSIIPGNSPSSRANSIVQDLTPHRGPRLGRCPGGSSTAIPHLSRRRCRTRHDWRRRLPQELRSTGARRPLGFARGSLRSSPRPAARSNRWAQGQPLLHHELSQGETRGLPRVGKPPQPRPRKEISSDYRSEFSPGRGAGSAAPPRRTRPLRQGRTQDELKKQRVNMRELAGI